MNQSPSLHKLLETRPFKVSLIKAEMVTDRDKDHTEKGQALMIQMDEIIHFCDITSEGAEV